MEQIRARVIAQEKGLYKLAVGSDVKTAAVSENLCTQPPQSQTIPQWAIM